MVNNLLQHPGYRGLPSLSMDSACTLGIEVCPCFSLDPLFLPLYKSGLLAKLDSQRDVGLLGLEREARKSSEYCLTSRSNNCSWFRLEPKTPSSTAGRRGGGSGPEDVMASSALDSQAVFEARALAIGLPDATLRLFITSGINTMASFAFSAQFQPGSSDERPLLELLNTVIGRAPTIAEISTLRRLFYESHSLALHEMKGRIERTSSDAPRTMAPAERTSRHVTQQLRIPSIRLSGEYECAHSLLDLVNQQHEDDVVRWVSIDQCVRRSQELLNIRKDPSFQMFVDKQGKVLAKSHEGHLTADCSTDLKARFALQRRGLAYDSCNLLAFSIHEEWISRLFADLYRAPPMGYAALTLTTILRADQELWVRLGEECRSGIAATGAGVRPLDVALPLMSNNPQIVFLLLPLPLGRPTAAALTSTVTPKVRIDPYAFDGAQQPPGKGKGKNRRKGGKGGSKDGGGRKDGKSADGPCPKFNSTVGCMFGPPKVCYSGRHVCSKCSGPHSVLQCPSKTG